MKLNLNFKTPRMLISLSLRRFRPLPLSCFCLVVNLSPKQRSKTVKGSYCKFKMRERKNRNPFPSYFDFKKKRLDSALRLVEMCVASSRTESSALILCRSLAALLSRFNFIKMSSFQLILGATKLWQPTWLFDEKPNISEAIVFSSRMPKGKDAPPAQHSVFMISARRKTGNGSEWW